MTSDLISIVIPCYNRERHVGASIESAVRQTHAPTEIVVVDDGSTDASLERVEAFGERVRCIRSKNGGAARARNLGLASSRGTYVQFLDSDDLLMPASIEAKLRCFEAFPDVDVVYDRVLMPHAAEFGAEFTPPRSLCELQASGILLPMSVFCEGVGLPTCAATPALYRRDVLEKHSGFDETFTVFDNLELNFRLYLRGVRFLFVDRIGYAYRNDRTIQRVTDREKWYREELYLDFSRMVEQAVAAGVFTGLLQSSLTEWVYNGGRIAAGHGNHRLARKYFELAARVSPDLRFGSAGFRVLERMLGTATAARLVAAAGSLAARRPRR